MNKQTSSSPEEYKKVNNVSKLPTISPSLHEKVDVSAPIPWRLRIGWEELLGEPIDHSHYYFDAEEPEAKCSSNCGSNCGSNGCGARRARDF